MLELEEKRVIINTFSELREKLDNFNRYYYYFDNASSRRKIIAREFVQSGNGYVFGANLPQYKSMCDPRGWVKVKDFTKEQLIDILQKAIAAHK